MDSKYLISPELLEALQAKQEIFFFQEALELYIPPQVGRYVGDDEPQDAAHAIGNWLDNPDKQCLLLLGDSGAGKTLFGQWLTRQSFENQKLHGRIPLFIPLLAQRHPEEGLVDRYLKKTCKIQDENQRELIKQQPLLLILDGFDEIHQKINLYRSNKLWQLKDVKIIISCRSQALENIYDYNSLFYPYDSQNKKQPEQLQEYVVNPFTEKQIDAYLQQYVSTHQNEIKLSNPDWLQWETYQSTIRKLPGLQDLLNSPFMLSIVVKVLPSIIAKHQDKESIEQLHLARINLYDDFVEQWFARQKLKLLNARHISDNCPIEDLFIKCSKSIANAMLQNNKTTIELTLHTISPLLAQQGFFGDEKSKLYAEKKNIKETKNTEIKYIDEEIIVNGDKIKLSLILSGCPVMKLQDNQYAFLHKSLLEYFAARKLFEGVMADANIALGYELNEKLLTNEPATLNFLAERVEQDEKLKERLFAVLEESKFDERVEIAAANAITILNYAGVSFSQKDLHRIRIKGADLSHSILDSVNLKDSDLREVTLRGAWLNNAKVGGALMQKVELGELSYLDVKQDICCIAYSPDRCYLVVAISGGSLQFFDVTSGKCISTLKFPLSGPICIAFSPNGRTLVSSGSWTNTINLWDALNYKYLGALNEHEDCVTSVAFSSDGHCFASGSRDKSVRLWNALNYQCLSVLKGHIDCITSVAFSSDRKILASGSEDKSVRLWDTLSYQCLSVLNGHTDYVTSVAFSPDEKILVSVSNDGSVHFWDILTYKPLGIFKHTSNINSIVFSPNGKMLAFGSSDGSVGLCDVLTYKPLKRFNGHTSEVNSVCFSSGEILASGSSDGFIRFWDVLSDYVTDKYEDNISLALSNDGNYLAYGNGYSVRLWNALSHKFLAILNGHTDCVTSVAFSPDGKILASGSQDKSVRLWDALSHQPLSVLNGHTDHITSIVFSPDGSCLASVDRDKTVRLWDVVSYKPLRVMENNKVISIAFSPDGKILAFGCSDNAIMCIYYDVIGSYKSFKGALSFLYGHKKSVVSLTFSADGKILASCDNRTVRLWDAISHQALNVVMDNATCVAFSPDGKTLASGTVGRTVSFWDITGKCLGIIQLTSSIDALAFKKEGEKLCLCVGSCGAIYIFEIKCIQSKFSFILLRSIGYNLGLKSVQLDLGGVVGLEPQNDCLLKQRKAVGVLSTKETDKVLEARSRLVLYNPKQPQYDLFSGQHLIMPRNAMVSMVRKKDNQEGSEHVFFSN